MCQVQLAHAVLERGVCLTQPANAQLYDLCTAIGILGSTEVATGAFQFSPTNISAMQCMDSDSLLAFPPFSNLFRTVFSYPRQNNKLINDDSRISFGHWNAT